MYVLDAAGVFAAVVVYFINCYFPSPPLFQHIKFAMPFLHEFTF